MILLQSYFVFLLSTAEEALINLPTSCSQSLDVIDVMRVLKLSEHPRRDLFYLTLAHFTLRSLFFFFMRLIGKCSQLSDLRLFGPASGGLPVDVGKAGEMLRVFVLWVPAWAQGWVHIPRGGIAGRMHRRAGVTAVTWWHIWPPGGNRCGVQPRSAAHQARLHSGHLAVELVLWRRKGGG